MAVHVSAACQELLELQHGVIARWQTVQAGLALPVVDNELRRGRWQTLYRGVYATYTGSPSRPQFSAAQFSGPGLQLC